MTEWALAHPYLTALIVIFALESLGKIALAFIERRDHHHHQRPGPGPAVSLGLTAGPITEQESKDAASHR
jgi:hypothetical protein